MTTFLTKDAPTAHHTGRHGRDMVGKHLQRAASGDIDAFMDFYDATSADVYRLACCFLGDRDAAGDALVRTYVAARRDVHRFDPEFLSAGAWLLAILQDELAAERASRPGEAGP